MKARALEYLNLQYPAITDLDVLFAILDSAKQLGIKVLPGIIRTHDALFLESLFATRGCRRGYARRELGVLAVDNEVSSMLTVASILGMQAGAVLVAVDNYTTQKSIDFEGQYDKLISDAIEISTRALAKLIGG